MVIQESLRVDVQKYDYTSMAYTTLYRLSESSILSASSQQQCCPADGFAIGGVYASTFTMQAKMPGFTAFSLRGIRLVVQTQYGTEDQWSTTGTYWITDAQRTTGEIFTVTASDAVGWLDTSCYNDDSNADTVGKVLFDKYSGTGRALEVYGTAAGWTQCLTTETNRFIQFQTGIPSMLSWRGWETATGGAGGHYCNSHIWSDQTQYEGWVELEDMNVIYALDTAEGVDSETPRDLYKMLAQLMGGYIYAEPDGALALGQFGAAHLSTVSVGMGEIQYGSCDIADFSAQLARVYVRAEYDDHEPWASLSIIDRDYSQTAYFTLGIESNLFLNWMARGFSGNRSLQTVVRGIWNAVYGYTDGAGVAHEPLQIRPFTCQVHSNKRFRLGQRIKIQYQALHESMASTYDSLITSIQWTFRGGVQLGCAGADSRVMADCMRTSKGGKAQKEARTRLRALEKRVADLGG